MKLVASNAKAITIDIPVGVECVNTETDEILFLRIDSRYLVAKGGHGGCAANGYK